jgi:hypothetical protein
MGFLPPTKRQVQPPGRRRIVLFRDGWATSKRRRARKSIVVPVWRRRAIPLQVAI